MKKITNFFLVLISLISFNTYISPALAICDVVVDFSGKWNVEEIDGVAIAIAGPGEKYEMEIFRYGSNYKYKRSDADIEIMRITAEDRSLFIRGVHPIHQFFETTLYFEKDMRSFEGRISYTQINPDRTIQGRRSPKSIKTLNETKSECLERMVTEMNFKLEAANANTERWQKRFNNKQQELEHSDMELEIAHATKQNAILKTIKLTKDLKLLKSKLDESNNKIVVLNNSLGQIDKLRSKLKAVSRQNRNLKTANENLEARISKLRISLQRAIEEQEDNADKELQVTILRRNLQKEANRTRILNQKIRRLQSDYDELRRKLLSAKDQVSILEAKIEKNSPASGNRDDQIENRWLKNNERKD